MLRTVVATKCVNCPRTCMKGGLHDEKSCDTDENLEERSRYEDIKISGRGQPCEVVTYPDNQRASLACSQY